MKTILSFLLGLTIGYIGIFTIVQGIIRLINIIKGML